jgi:biopolymer transport protein ExbB
MFDFLRGGGPVMYLLLLVSIVGAAFIIERALALRWRNVIPRRLEEAVENCDTPEGAAQVINLASGIPSPLSRLLLLANEHLDWPKADNINSIETAARHEVVKLDRGLVVLEIIVGIAPLTGLVGTLHGLITLFASLGVAGMTDNAALAKGISIALNTTLMGLVVAIPALIAWSYFNKKVEALAVEMEALCERYLRSQYRERIGA